MLAYHIINTMMQRMRRGAAFREQIRKRAYSTRASHGFTIVELLIVIVIIAILAAITIVAYNSLTLRAQRAKVAKTVQSYTTALEMYKVDHGQYPEPRFLGSSNDSFICLGREDQFPADAANGFEEGECSYITQGESTRWTTSEIDHRNGVVRGALEDYMTGLATEALPITAISAYGQVFHSRAVVYNNYQGPNSPTPNAFIGYDIKGDTCAATSHIRTNYSVQDNISSCEVVLERGS